MPRAAFSEVTGPDRLGTLDIQYQEDRLVEFAIGPVRFLPFRLYVAIPRYIDKYIVARKWRTLISANTLLLVTLRIMLTEGFSPKATRTKAGTNSADLVRSLSPREPRAWCGVYLPVSLGPE